MQHLYHKMVILFPILFLNHILVYCDQIVHSPNHIHMLLHRLHLYLIWFELLHWMVLLVNHKLKLRKKIFINLNYIRAKFINNVNDAFFRSNFLKQCCQIYNLNFLFNRLKSICNNGTAIHTKFTVSTYWFTVKFSTPVF